MKQYLTHISYNIGDMKEYRKELPPEIIVGLSQMGYLPVLNYSYVVTTDGLSTTSKYLMAYNNSYITRGSFVFEKLHGNNYGLRIIQPKVNIKDSYSSPRCVLEIANKMYNKGGIPHLSSSPCTGNMGYIRDQLEGVVDSRLVDLRVYEQFINSRNLRDGAGECIYMEDYLSLHGIIKGLNSRDVDMELKVTIIKLLNWFLEEGINITYYGTLGDIFEEWLGAFDTSKGYIQFTSDVCDAFHRVGISAGNRLGVPESIGPGEVIAANQFIEEFHHLATEE